MNNCKYYTSETIFHTSFFYSLLIYYTHFINFWSFQFLKKKFIAYVRTESDKSIEMIDSFPTAPTTRKKINA